MPLIWATLYLVLTGLAMSLAYVLWPVVDQAVFQSAQTARAKNVKAAPKMNVIIAWPGSCLAMLVLSQQQDDMLAIHNASDLQYLLHITVFCILIQQAKDLFRDLGTSRSQTFYTSALCHRLVTAEDDLVAAHMAIGRVYKCLRSGPQRMQANGKGFLSELLGTLYDQFDEAGMELLSIRDEYGQKMQQEVDLSTELMTLIGSLTTSLTATAARSGFSAIIARNKATALDEVSIVAFRHGFVQMARSSLHAARAGSTVAPRSDTDTARNDQRAVHQAGLFDAAGQFVRSGNTSTYSKGSSPLSHNKLLDDWVPQPKQFVMTKPDTAAWPDEGFPEQVSVLLKHSRSVVCASMLCQLDLALLGVSQAAVSRLRHTGSQPLPDFVTALTDFCSCHAALKKLTTKGSVMTSETHQQVTKQLEHYNSARQQLQRALCCVVPVKKLSKAVQQAYSAQVPLLNLPHFQPTWRPDATHL